MITKEQIQLLIRQIEILNIYVSNDDYHEEMKKEQIQLLIRQIEILDIYVPDDHREEMKEEFGETFLEKLDKNLADVWAIINAP